VFGLLGKKIEKKSGHARVGNKDNHAKPWGFFIFLLKKWPANCIAELN
jgi:hypothetical protein